MRVGPHPHALQPRAYALGCGSRLFMAQKDLDAQIDRLYQLPLDEFTEARNALAKEVAKESKKEAEEIRRLVKPPLPAWAVNQVYWHARPAYHALTASAAALRNAHAAALSGKHADLRAAGKAHEDASTAVLKAALTLLERSGNPVTDATKQAISTTLHALTTSGDPPGRLARTLQPTGFELLAGLPVSAASGGRAAPPAAPRPAPPTRVEPRTKDAARTKALAKAKEAVAAAGRAEKAAEQTAKRDEFEAARLTRDAERASQKLTDAKQALEEAQEAVAAAEQAFDDLQRKKDAASRRARQSAEALASARVRTGAAQADLDRTTGS
jgi:hypothetical protein